MLKKIMSIRAVLEVAVKLEFEGVGELSGAHNALQDLHDVHTALLLDDDANEDLKAIDEDDFNG